MSPVNPVPERYGALTPYLIVKNAANAIEFYKKAFGATEIMRMPRPDGKIMHSEISIGGRVLMMADEVPSMGARSAESIGGSPVSFLLYVQDVDAFTQKAVDAGAKIVRSVQDQFYGDRTGLVADPFGLQWTISTHKEDVTPEEMQKRAAAAQAAAASHS